MNVSSLYFKLETTLLEEIEEAKMKAGSELMYVANCCDLWKYFLAKVKKYYKLFSAEDYQMIKKIIMTTRMQLLNYMMTECKKELD